MHLIVAHEDERSLQKRPDLIPEQLLQGGLIVGALEGGRGPLMSLTGMALERITRERSELPPGARLPERPVYLLDPNSKRMIMITNREPGWRRSEFQSGLFAEIVEIDEEGKPIFTLSTNQIILPDEQYQAVAVGPNKFSLPPSFIDMVEEDEPGKKKFVPWNIYLASLQGWMDESKINPNEDFPTFMTRFMELKKKSKDDSEKKIRTAFKGGPQAFSENTAPYNIILTTAENYDALTQASRDAGLYPIYIRPDELAKEAKRVTKLDEKTMLPEDVMYSIRRFLPDNFNWGTTDYLPALITIDWEAIERVAKNRELYNDLGGHPGVWLGEGIHQIAMYNPSFSRVYMSIHKSASTEVKKDSNGVYSCPIDGDFYQKFLYKVKADLLLTTFVRGGAPIAR